MKKRYAYFPSFCAAGELTPTEEEVKSWLLDSPRLLAWPHKINWLWWFQVGPRESALRLYGIDSSGTLIIVEITKDRGDETDPFANLVLEIKGLTPDYDWSGEVLYEEWRKCWAKALFEDDDQLSVERSLKRRNKIGNPRPVLIVVVASTRPNFRLSPKGRKNFEQLQKWVGGERVRLSVISGTSGVTRLRVQCTTFNDNDHVAPSRALVANARLDRRRSRRSPCLKQGRGWRYGLRFVAQG